MFVSLVGNFLQPVDFISSLIFLLISKLSFSANIESENEDGRKSRIFKRPDDKIKRKRKIKFEDDPISDIISETKSEQNSLDNLDEKSDRTRFGFFIAASIPRVLPALF